MTSNGHEIAINLEQKYTEILSLLKLLCKYYDRDCEEVLALPISTVIRVLVHDTNSSTSLLKALKKNINL